ncbi:MAG: hypothetical protein IPM57_03675 [Oligoflexia bacterium]|nr:hypothetical protein [Oligoflexia bacterium]
MSFNPIEVFKLLLRSWKLIFLALVFSLSTALYQRLTGPTHPKRIKIVVDNQKFSFKTLRSHETTSGALIEIPKGLEKYNPQLVFRRYPTNDEWSKIPFSLGAASLPIQPAAGKLEYQIQITNTEGINKLYPQSPVRLRYKDPVPLTILIPHIYSMFAALLFGAWAILEAVLFKRRKDKEPLAIPSAVLLCTGFFLLGGFILGPFVQKFAFGEYWTGFPFGDDFTDNKVLFSVIFWLLAFVLNFKKPHPKSAIAAAIIMFAMYLIPHSFGGSQFDYEAGKVKTGLQKKTN